MKADEKKFNRFNKVKFKIEKELPKENLFPGDVKISKSNVL